jgi:SAM-dependent methyltransferase
MQNSNQNPLLACKTLEEFLDSWINQMHRVAVEDVLTSFPPGSRILDVGAGMGFTSLLFASKGHTVFPVEPSLECCRIIDALANKFGYRLTIFESTLETLSTKERFDLCVFNASFHHLDDPLLALRNCYDLLAPGGTIYLINEQVLKFFHRKKWYERMMKDDPQKICHYGGNEHIYRVHEYRDMVNKSGFRMLEERIPAYYLSPRVGVSHVLNFKNELGFIYSDGRVLARYVWYLFLQKALGYGFFLALAKRLSLITCTFIAEKPH